MRVLLKLAVALVVLAAGHAAIAQEMPPIVGPNAVGSDSDPLATIGAAGSLDATALCSNIPTDCSVKTNAVRLTFSRADAKVTGRGWTGLSYKPYPECAAWGLNSGLFFEGTRDLSGHMQGTVTGLASVVAEIHSGKSCHFRIQRFQIEGTWQATVTGEAGSGRVTLTMADTTTDLGFDLQLMPVFVENQVGGPKINPCWKVDQGFCTQGYSCDPGLFRDKGDTHMCAAVASRG